MNHKVSLFHIGPPKTATTWMYQCLKEHPHIVTSPKDSVHYFDMFFHKGEAWYHRHFDHKEDAVLYDPTPAYSLSAVAPERIAAYNPDARIILCLRHPIERAFSNYWHAKKKNEINVSFDHVLKSYEYFSWWLEAGMYGTILERWLRYFPREQILVQFFDDIQKDPRAFMQEIYAFADVDTSFMASSLQRKINTAGVKHNFLFRTLRAMAKALRVKELLPGRWYRKLKSDRAQQIVSRKKEYARGVEDGLYQELLEVVMPDIEKLEQLLNVNLDHWKQ